jgi:hypothetical protein
MNYTFVFRTALIASLVALSVVAPGALAGKGGNGHGNGGANAGDRPDTVTWSMVTDHNGDRSPSWNDVITFDVSTDDTDRPWVLLNCYQDDTWVSTMSHGFFPTYLWPNYTLASTAWTGGAATCVATLYMVTASGDARNLASSTFDVGA